jgi:NAD+ synthase (glutamine-hydrolysing)
MADQHEFPSLAEFGYCRVAAVTPELHLGRSDKNATEIAQLLVKLSEEAVELAVFPELCLTGYTCGDLFHLSGTHVSIMEALDSLLSATSRCGTTAIVGLPWLIDGRLYNMAAVICGGKLQGLVPKSRLPNSGEFYDRRWFSPAETLRRKEIEFAEQMVPVGADLIFHLERRPELTFGIEICEDLWTAQPPSGWLATEGALLIANLSASNEILGKAEYRKSLVAQQSGRCVCGYIYAAAGPGESSTDLVFSGHSMIAENGSIMAEAERFRFDSNAIIADLDLQKLEHDRSQNTSFRDQRSERPARYVAVRSAMFTRVPTLEHLHRQVRAHPFVPPQGVERSTVCSEIFAIQATGLARRLRAVKPKTLVLGLSGGLDSTLALLVAIEAIDHSGTNTKLVTLTMPGLGTTSRTKNNALELAKAMGVEVRTVSIVDAVKLHLKDIGHPEDQHDITFENAQARERTQVLMDVANQTQGLVLGTGDLSEAALGWCTFNGDHMSMYHVNAGVPKTLVRYLIGWCAEQEEFSLAAKVLNDILDTPISPELLPADKTGQIVQKTEDSVGPYELVDFFLYHTVRCGASADKVVMLAELAFQGDYDLEQIAHWFEKFANRFRTQQFKRSSMPDGPKVGSVALSPRGDWRMPSDLA